VSMVSFEAVSAEYDAGRPPYPSEVFDALEPLSGMDVLEGGAGTGIATRPLIERGARVVPLDIGWTLLERARTRTPQLPAVVGDGAVLPFSDRSFDLVCFAQAWHWLDEARRCPEVARVLRPGGRWAGWWSHARADGEPWFDEYCAILEAACPAFHRTHRDGDWGLTLVASGLFDVDDRQVIPWVRELSTAAWIADQLTHSYVFDLSDGERNALVDALTRVVDEAFPDGAMRVPFETQLWVAQPA
jgi:SAM-dependent methyltransferase